MTIKTKITITSIKSLVPEDKRLNDTEISGFHARITPTGLITYYLFLPPKWKTGKLPIRY